MGKSKTHKMAARCDERHSKGYWLSVPPGRRTAAKLLSKDEARRIAANIAKLPEA